MIDVHSHLYPHLYLSLLSEQTGVPRVEDHPDGRHLVLFENEETFAGGSRPFGRGSSQRGSPKQ